MELLTYLFQVFEAFFQTQILCKKFCSRWGMAFYALGAGLPGFFGRFTKPFIPFLRDTS